MKIIKFLDANTVMLEVQEGVCVTVHSHTKGECEIMFGGVTGKVVLTTPPFDNGRFETSGGSNIVFARYQPRLQSHVDNDVVGAAVQDVVSEVVHVNPEL